MEEYSVIAIEVILCDQQYCDNTFAISIYALTCELKIK